MYDSRHMNLEAAALSETCLVGGESNMSHSWNISDAVP
jgi:hypothetical protein